MMMMTWWHYYDDMMMICQGWFDFDPVCRPGWVSLLHLLLSRELWLTSELNLIVCKCIFVSIALFSFVYILHIWSNIYIVNEIYQQWKENYSGYFRKIQFVLYSNLMLCIPESLRPENCSIFRKSIFMLTFWHDLGDLFSSRHSVWVDLVAASVTLHH